VVDIRVDLTTLAELDDNSAEIPGWGPVIADIARQTITEQTDTEWRYTVTDPQTRQVTHNGTTRRRPTTTQKRQIQAQSPTCVFYTCRMPSGDCDIDHRQAWADGGTTEHPNLAPLCRHDHQLKHHGWTVETFTPGIYVWTSPLGLQYTVEAQPP
jgi:hypothetical protein